MVYIKDVFLINVKNAKLLEPELCLALSFQVICSLKIE